MTNKKSKRFPLRQYIEAIDRGEDPYQIDIEDLKNKITDSSKSSIYTENTWNAYETEISRFAQWAGVSLPFPVSDTYVIFYLEEMADKLAPSTLSHFLSSLSMLQMHMGYPDIARSPKIQLTMKRIRQKRIKNGWQVNHVRTLSLEKIKKIISEIEYDTRGIRDRALLLLGFLCALRQNEASSMRIENFVKTSEGNYTHKTLKYKRDQDSSIVFRKLIPQISGDMCPVNAINQLIMSIGDISGPLFRSISRTGNYIKNCKGSDKGLSHTSINSILRKRIDKAGIFHGTDHEKYKLLLNSYSYDSLRSSFIKILDSNGTPHSKIGLQTHNTVHRVYYETELEDEGFRKSIASDIIKIIR